MVGEYASAVIRSASSNWEVPIAVEFNQATCKAVVAVPHAALNIGTRSTVVIRTERMAQNHVWIRPVHPAYLQQFLNLCNTGHLHLKRHEITGCENALPEIVS